MDHVLARKQAKLTAINNTTVFKAVVPSFRPRRRLKIRLKISCGVRVRYYYSIFKLLHAPCLLTLLNCVNVFLFPPVGVSTTSW